MAKKNIIPTNCFFANGGEDYELTAITVASTAENQVIVAAEGVAYDKITVVPVQGQEKEAAPSDETQEIVPDEGMVLSKVTVAAVQTEEKTVAPSQSAQTVTPSEGKFLSKVTVQPAALRDGRPLEVATVQEAKALLTNPNNIGVHILYTGSTSGNYTHNAMYIVEYTE